MRARYIALAMIVLGVAAPGAAAAESCPRPTTVNVLDDGRPILESIGFDRKGRLFYTDAEEGLLMIPRRSAKPRPIVDIEQPGGIAFRKDGKLLVGFGNGVQQAADGPLNPEAGLMLVDPAKRTAKVHIEGLSMANGIVRGPGRTLYASNDIAGGIDKVVRKQVELSWSPTLSPNGMEIDPTKRFLYSVQTFQPAAVVRIPLANPLGATPWYTAPPADIAAGFDGTAIDRQGRLFVAANGAGQVWRIDGPGQACVLADRVPFPSGPSDVAIGRGKRGFPRSSVYATTFGGELLEITNAR